VRVEGGGRPVAKKRGRGTGGQEGPTSVALVLRCSSNSDEERRGKVEEKTSKRKGRKQRKDLRGKGGKNGLTEPLWRQDGAGTRERQKSKPVTSKAARNWRGR